MNRLGQAVSLKGPGKPRVDGIVLLLRVIGKLAFWALLAVAFLAVIAWSCIALVVASTSGGRR